MDYILKYKYLITGFIALVLYANTLSHDYAWDDQLVVSQNTVTQKGVKGLKEIWTDNVYIPQRPLFRPVPQTFFALEWQFFPNEPFVAHFINVLLYVLTCISLVIALYQFFPLSSKWILGLIAVVFTLLPIHSEVVSNIKSSDELLAGLFLTWAFICAKKGSFKQFVLSVLLFILSILSKLSVLPLFPFLVVLLFSHFKEFNKVKNFLFKQLETIQTLAALSMVGWIHFHFFEFYWMTPFFLIWVTLRTNFHKTSLLNFALVLFSAFLLKLFLNNEFAILIYLFILYRVEDDSISFKNWQYLVLLGFAPIIILESELQQLVLLVPFSLLVFMFHQIRSEKKHKVFTIYSITSILFLIGLSIAIPETKNILFFLIILSPILYYILVKFVGKKSYLVFGLIFYTSILFEFQDNYFNTSVQDFKIKVENIEVLPSPQETLVSNQPYHNILVAAKNNSVKAATICRIQLIYLQKLIFPTALVHQHGTWQIELATWKDWDVYLSILIHLLLLYLAYYFYKQKYYIAMWGILWYFITMSIYTNIVRLMPDTLAERFLFLPSIGFSMAFVSGLYFLLKKYLKEEKKSIVALAILLFPLMSYYAYKTVDRNKDWKNNYTLAANTLPFAKNNAAINAQYALELNKLIKNNQIENIDSAKQLVIEHYEKSIEIFPDFYGPNADLASYYILEAQPDKAFPYLLESTRLDPKQWIHHYYLGLIYYERKKYSEAIDHFNTMQNDATLQKRALEFPELLEAYEYKARCLHNIGKDKEAYILLNEAISIFNQKSSYVLLANLYRVTGKPNLAIETFKRLLELTPNDQELINTIQLLEQGKIY